MAQSEGKKRRRESHASHKPHKRHASESSTNRNDLKVSFRHGSGSHPVLASTPGLTAPSFAFKAFAKPMPSKNNDGASNHTTHQLLLHSDQHPRLDFTASSVAGDNALSHYVAVFDPSTNELQITPAHRLNLRSHLRPDPAEVSAERERRALWQQREELGLQFGTKKTKKALEGRRLNAITASGGTSERSPGKNNVEAAVLDTVADAHDGEAKDAAEAELLASRPIPPPNLDAETVDQVYPFDVLVPPAEARFIPLKEWQQSLSTGAAIETNHAYPASRLRRHGRHLLEPPTSSSDQPLMRLKALRYLALLLEFHDALQPAGRMGKKVPHRAQLGRLLSAWPASLVDSLRDRFARNGFEMPKFCLDRLYAYICALALLVDGFTTEVTAELKLDLRMESSRTIELYFKELGCRVRKPSEREAERLGMTRHEALAARMAVLKVPVELPKVETGRRR